MEQQKSYTKSRYPLLASIAGHSFDGSKYDREQGGRVGAVLRNDPNPYWEFNSIFMIEFRKRNAKINLKLVLVLTLSYLNMNC